MDIYPNNTTSQFVTKLPKHFELTGDWIVSLKEILVPITIVNIVGGTYMFEIRDTASGTTSERQTLPARTHVSIMTIIQDVNKLIKAKYGITLKQQMVHGR